MSYIKTLAEQLGTEASSGILGMVLGGINDKRQVSQQHRLTDIQIEAQKNLTDYNMMKQLEMWKNTSYGPQIEQMKLAGINPALLYGMSGGGSQTTGNTGSSATGGQAQQNPGEIQQMIGMGIQGGLLEAQRKLLEAQKNNVEADTKKKLEGDIPNVQMQTQSLAQGIQNQKAQQKLTEVETTLKEIDVKFAKESYDDRIDRIIYETDIAREIYDQQAIETFVSRATQNARISTLRTEAIGAILRNGLTQAQTQKQYSDIEVNKANINEIANSINQKWEQVGQGYRALDQKDKEIAIHKFAEEMKSAYPSIWAVMGNALQTLTRTIDGATNTPTYKVPTK